MPLQEEGEQLRRCLRASYLLLKVRSRSEKELADRLKKKGFPTFLIKGTIEKLRRQGYIDDLAFSREWARYKLSKPLGRRRIVWELKAKGIDREIIEKVLSDQDIIKEDESAVVYRLATEKLKTLKNKEAQTAKRLTAGFLLRRGFSPQTVYDILERLADLKPRFNRGCKQMVADMTDVQ